jgi:hypothetical protein
MAGKILPSNPKGCLEKSDQSLLCLPLPAAPLADFMKEKREEEKSVRISQMKNTSALTEIDCFLLGKLVMVTIIFLNLSSCL